jgi:hypothetical protein
MVEPWTGHERRGRIPHRWSRRKLGADPNQPAPAAPAEVPPEATEESLHEEELALLPRIEDLTPESDISGFLRKGVPDLLKKAALRRMWALDPAIRDYVGDARDYAWDWNIPATCHAAARSCRLRR